MFQFVQKFVAGVKVAVRSARENAQRILSAARASLVNARTISLAACRRMSAGLQAAPAITVEAGRQGSLVAARWLASVAGLTVLCLLAVIAFLARGLMLTILVGNLAIGREWALLSAVTDAMGSLSYALNISAATLAAGAVLSAFQRRLGREMANSE